MASRLSEVPLFGFGVGTKSAAVSAQMRTNMYLETQPDAEKTQIAYYPREGMVNLGQSITTTTAAGSVVGPARGMIVLYKNAISATTGAAIPEEWGLFAIGRALVTVPAPTWAMVECTNSADAITAPGQYGLLNDSGPVRFADNGVQCLIVSGAGGFIYDYSSLGNATTTYTQIASSTAFPQNTGSCCFLAGYFVVPDPTVAGRFRWCTAYDGTAWDPLDYATAESSPDPLRCTFAARGELMLFGTRSVEFWATQATGTGLQPFTKIQGTTLDWGTDAINTVRTINGTVAFLGRNQQGERQVVQLGGYQAQVISTPDIDARIAADAAPDAANALVLTIGGHTFYQLNLSTESWRYDATESMKVGSPVWNRVTTAGSRHAGNYSVAVFGRYVVSDYRDQRFYYVDSGTYTDDTDVITREMVSKHVSNPEQFTVDELFIDFEVGSALVSGQGSNPQVMLQWSKDGGRTWGNEVWQTLGVQGAYRTRAKWYALGRANDWMFRLRMTDPVKLVPVYSAMRIRP